jgi:hypothetical protein
MSKYKKIILIVLISLSLSGLFLYAPQKIPENPETTEINLEDSIAEPISVYDFMSQLQDEGKISFTEKNYTGMGKFIDSINGLKGSGAKNWIYYVNGMEAEVGVSNYKINKGDILSWKYE